MTNAAIYARYSTDLQNEKSIEDQFALCRKYAERNGLALVRQYSDAAKSGASMLGRDGLQDMLADAKARQFEVLIVESLDRLSRDQEDLAHIHKRLRYYGIKLIDAHGLAADDIQVGVRGIVSALYLRDLADKTRRGLAGRVTEGKSAGGRAYGYRPVKGEPGELEVVEEEAEVVRRIYREYAMGISARMIAHRLNADGIEAPRGQSWRASTFIGSAQKGSGMLRLDLYQGERVWNKVKYVKDPETGKRVPRVNSPEEWQRTSVPHLRIVDKKTWTAVQARLGSLKPRNKGSVRKHRLLTGILKCGCCGSGMAVNGTWKNRLRVQCTQYRESRSCDHSRTYFLDHIEAIVLSVLRGLMTSPDWVADGAKMIVEEKRNGIVSRLSAYNAAKQKVERAEARLDAALMKSLDGEISKAELARLRQKLDADIAEGKAELRAIGKPTKAELNFDPEVEYTRVANGLYKIVETAEKDTGPEAIQFIRAVQGIVGKVVVKPVKTDERPEIEMLGSTYALNEKTSLVERVVAGAGFEPAAFRL